MPLSVNLGPFRYTPPRNTHQPAGLTVLLILGGFAAVVLLLAAAVLFAVVVAGAWLTGLVVGAQRLDALGSARRYASSVTSWVRSVFDDRHVAS